MAEFREEDISDLVEMAATVKEVIRHAPEAVLEGDGRLWKELINPIEHTARRRLGGVACRVMSSCWYGFGTGGIGIESSVMDEATFYGAFERVSLVDFNPPDDDQIAAHLGRDVAGLVPALTFDICDGLEGGPGLSQLYTVVGVPLVLGVPVAVTKTVLRLANEEH